MRRFISLLLLVVAMLLLTTSIVGAESPIASNSKSGCGSDLPGNGKGKAKGRNKNCTNESNSLPGDTEFTPVPTTTPNLTEPGNSGLNPVLSAVPDWSALGESGLPNQELSFDADTSSLSASQDCFIDDGVGVNQGAGQHCKSGATTFTEVEIETFFVDARVECAGDWVRVSGKFHFLTHTTLDGNGRYHLKVQFSPMGVSGFGFPSGTFYQGTGVTQWTNIGIVGAPQTYINNFRLISQGSAPNLMVHVNTHTTVNANGDVTTDFDHTTISCR